MAASFFKMLFLVGLLAAMGGRAGSSTTHEFRVGLGGTVTTSGGTPLTSLLPPFPDGGGEEGGMRRREEEEKEKK